MPLVCSVSSDNWLKIYSLDDRSLFRSYNVSNFSLSSVDCIQFQLEVDNNELNKETDNEKNSRTILFLSCWDNTTYLYDMNYNRCFFSLANTHDDAVSRVRLLKTSSNSIFVLTSSWDSLIKLHHLTLKNKSITADFLNESIKVKCLSELAHDSSVIDFFVSKKYLASLCDDGNVYIWKFNTKLNDLEHEDNLNESFYSFFYSIQSSSDIGKITDCKIIESNQENSNSLDIKNFDNINTIAFCTSFGSVKIVNIETNTELFSLRLNIPQQQFKSELYSKLNKLYYSSDYIITIDSNGFIYFINSSSNTQQESHFLSHTIKLSSNCLQALSIYKEFIICVADSDGYLYFLSIYDL